MQELLTEKELAAKAKCSVQYLRKLRADKKLFDYIKLNRLVRYPADSVERVLKKNKIESE